MRRAGRVSFLRRFRQWFWSRYSLVAEVQTNEKALLEMFHRAAFLDAAVYEAEEHIGVLESEVKALTAKCAAQELLLAALGEVESSKAGSQHD